MNLRRNNRSGRHLPPEADVEKYYIKGWQARPAAGTRRAGASYRGRAGDGEGAASAASRPRLGAGPPLRGTGLRTGLDSAGASAGTGQPGRAAALGGRGSDATAFPFSSPGPWSSASSSSLGPPRRLSLGDPPASLLHQGRADPQKPSRKVRGCCRSPQLLVAIFNPPPPPAPVSPPPAGCLTD